MSKDVGLSRKVSPSNIKDLIDCKDAQGTKVKVNLLMIYDRDSKMLPSQFCWEGSKDYFEREKKSILENMTNCLGGYKEVIHWYIIVSYQQKSREI